MGHEWGDLEWELACVIIKAERSHNLQDGELGVPGK